MPRERHRAAERAAETAKSTVDAPTVEVEQVTLQDVVDEACSIARQMHATNCYMTVRQTPCGKLEGSGYPNGLGGETFYGVYLETEWKTKHPPFFESLVQADALLVCTAVNEFKEETWRITLQRDPDSEPEVTRTSSTSDQEEEEEFPDVEPMARIKNRGDGSSQRSGSSMRRMAASHRQKTQAKRRRR